MKEPFRIYLEIRIYFDDGKKVNHKQVGVKHKCVNRTGIKQKLLNKRTSFKIHFPFKITKNC